MLFMGNGFPVPPCPDPERYTLVMTKEGNYWRLNRGTGKKEAKLNEIYELSKKAMEITAPAAKRIVDKLREYIHGLSTGRINAKVSGLLRRQLNTTGKVDYSYFKGFDLQPDYPMGRLLQVPVEVRVDNEVLNI